MKVISRTEYFEAAHLLPGHIGKCQNLHGHSYMFKATITSENEREFGMILDYAYLKDAMKQIMPDHMYLHFKGNPISEDIVAILDKYDLKYMTFESATSAENMAPELKQLLEDYIQNELGFKDVKVVEVELRETVNSSCIVRD